MASKLNLNKINHNWTQYKFHKHEELKKGVTSHKQKE